MVDRRQQEEIIKILSCVERDHAWPTRAIALGTMEEWEWKMEDGRPRTYPVISSSESTFSLWAVAGV